MNKKPEKLWGGRFNESISSISEQISESISFDYQLYRFDIQGSIAHVRMLSRQKILTANQSETIEKALNQIQGEIESGMMEYHTSLEDIHTHIEKRLIEIIGDDGKALHTGRSRNDQVSTDTHLFLKFSIAQQKKLLHGLLETIIDISEKNSTVIWAGYTHTQIAQPVLLSHYLMAYFWKFYRDYSLLSFAENETDISPLGAAAMAGANYPIDREFTATELKFKNIYENSMDAVSDRDYQLSYHFFASRFFIHVSSLCEDLILYSTTEFGYVRMGDKVTTGSSIMPQKKNPDIAELLRGKSSRVIGHLNALMVMLKSLPLTYNRDMQEDKVYLFDSVKQVEMAISGVQEILLNCKFIPERVLQNLRKGFAVATDIADYLVREYKVPFRVAHELTGKLVLYCEQRNIFADELSSTDIETVWGSGYKLPVEVLTLESCIKSKQGRGSTSYEEVKKQIDRAKLLIKNMD